MQLPALLHRESQTSSRWAEWDRRWALALHHAADHRFAVHTLVVVSKLGNGALWYGAIALLIFSNHYENQQCAVRMLLLGIVNLMLYYALKRGTGRPRPYVNCAEIRACVPALDEFSFPSGHTLHAVAYSLLVSHYFPAFAVSLWLFTALVMTSRVALGLHYPSDVIAAFLIGLVTGGLMLTTV